ncbi:ATP-binding protein [bacterium]|nr:ATP-binding protein [bacterium]
MSEPIEEAAKRLQKNTTPNDTQGENSPSSSTISQAGDPNCEFCGGLGYIRANYPVGHPNFGKLQICVCRQDEISQHEKSRLFAFSQLKELKGYVFDNFKSRGRIGLGEHQANSLERAFTQSTQYARNLKGWLLLRGNYGCGKTHLAAAIANFAVSFGIGTLFITVPDLLDSLRFSYNSSNTSFEERFEEIRNSQLLILDDFGTQNATEWAQEKLFQIINFRYINKLPLVVTTNLELDQIEGRIRSRLEDPELVTPVHIQAPDYRRPMDPTGSHELSSLHLHGTQTFETFSLRKSEGLSQDLVKNLDKVLLAAKAFANQPQGWLVFTGTYGSGKTHLAAAIANYQASIGKPPLFIVVPDLLDHLRATFNPNSNVPYDRRFEEIRTAPLLILDDLGTQAMTPWVKEKLYQVFNYRYNGQLPTVITTSDLISEMDPRIRSRILDTRFVNIKAIQAPTFTGKKR